MIRTERFICKPCDIHWPEGGVSPGLAESHTFDQIKVTVFRQHIPAHIARAYQMAEDDLLLQVLVRGGTEQVVIREAVDPQMARRLTALVAFVRDVLRVTDEAVPLDLRESDFRLLITNFALANPLQLVIPDGLAWDKPHLRFAGMRLQIRPVEEMDCRARVQVGWSPQRAVGQVMSPLEWRADSVMSGQWLPEYAQLEDDWRISYQGEHEEFFWHGNTQF